LFDFSGYGIIVDEAKGTSIGAGMFLFFDKDTSAMLAEWELTKLHDRGFM
jgi:hypothetical protein